MIYVVLGMHKSGTTLVSRMLHDAGIAMVEAADPTVGYDQRNTWEREATKRINHELLDSSGAFSLAPLARRAPAPATLDRMRSLVSACSRLHADWGFKDPRSCLTYDCWADVLPEHRVVAVYRQPAEAWSHYWSSTTGRRRWTIFRQFLARWSEYNEGILAAVAAARAPAIVVEYARLMDGDDELLRLERFLGRPIADPRDAGMRRSRTRPTGLYAVARMWHRLGGGGLPEEIAARLESRRR